MITYSLASQQPNLTTSKDFSVHSSRSRVIGFIEDKKCVLYSIASPNKTEIQLFNQYGVSTTVIAFNKYMDIIAADISFDMEMILYTERTILILPEKSNKKIQNSHSFKYESVLCNINSFSKIRVFDDYKPISSYFLPYIEDNKFTSGFDFYKQNNNQVFSENDVLNVTQKVEDAKNYQFIHVIGEKILHYRSTLKKSKIHVRPISGGINIEKCQKWFFSKRDMTFYSFNDGKFNAYSIFNEGKKGAKIELDSSQYYNDQSSVLPSELALNPSTLTNLPFFRFSSGISYVVKIKNASNKIEYGIIEQLYKGEDSCLSFTVGTVYGKFKSVVSVRGVQPDLPIGFLSPPSNRNIVFVFVPNSFITFVDFNYPKPHISMMPRIFSETTVISQLISTCNSDTNFLIDLENGKLFEASFEISSFPKSLHYGDCTVISIISRLIVAFPSEVPVSSAISNLPTDVSFVQFFFRNIFSLINQVNPTKTCKKVSLPRTVSDSTNNAYHSNLSTNNLIAKSKSDEIFDSISSSSSSNKSDSKSSIQFPPLNFSDLTKAIMKKADFVLRIRDSIEQLLRSNALTELRIFLIEIAAEFEAKMAKMPESPTFIISCSKRALWFCPLSIRQPLIMNNLIYYLYKDKKACDEKDNKKMCDEKDNKKVCDGNEDKKDCNSNEIIENINRIKSNEKNQMIYWKKRFDFVIKDANFFLDKKSSKKRSKSTVFINEVNRNQKNYSQKDLSIDELFLKDEKMKFKSVNYKRRTSLHNSRINALKYINRKCLINIMC